MVTSHTQNERTDFGLAHKQVGPNGTSLRQPSIINTNQNNHEQQQSNLISLTHFFVLFVDCRSIVHLELRWFLSQQDSSVAIYICYKLLS